jgi:hypothetical protein
MTTDFRALCAELLDKYDLEWRARERIKAALAAEPVPPVKGEVAELVAWLHGQDGGIGRRATYSRIADLLSRLASQSVSEGPSDHELSMTYAYAVAAAVDNKRRPFKNEDVEAALLAGLRAVLTRWGNQS